jgi:hypothetical protein
LVIGQNFHTVFVENVPKVCFLSGKCVAWRLPWLTLTSYSSPRHF